MAEIPPGYYTDPNGQERWWDGAQWGPAKAEVKPDQTSTLEQPPQSNESEIPSAGPSINKRSNACIWAVVAVFFVALILLLGLDVRTVVTQEEKPETYDRIETPTGNYNIKETEQILCQEGDTTQYCLGMILASYGASCVERPLTPQGRAFCESTSGFMDNVLSMVPEYQRNEPLYGIEPVKGFAPDPEVSVTRESKGTHQEVQTRTAYCFFGTIGDC